MSLLFGIGWVFQPYAEEQIKPITKQGAENIAPLAAPAAETKTGHWWTRTETRDEIQNKGR